MTTNKSKNDEYEIKLTSYTRTVKNKDGKKIETFKGTKRVDDKWFAFSDGKWVPTTKEACFDGSHETTEAFGEPEFPQLDKVFDEKFNKTFNNKFDKLFDKTFNNKFFGDKQISKN